jgi:hypothetical protein
MNVKFTAAFEAVKAYLSEKVPELTPIVSQWVEPYAATDGLAILLPHSHPTEDRIAFTLTLWVYTVQNDTDVIAGKQIDIAEKVFTAIYAPGELPQPVLKGVITESEYLPPKVETPNTGQLRLMIELIMDYEDDGEE